MTTWELRENGKEAVQTIQDFTETDVTSLFDGVHEIYSEGGQPRDLVYFVIGWLQETDLL